MFHILLVRGEKCTKHFLNVIIMFRKRFVHFLPRNQNSSQVWTPFSSKWTRMTRIMFCRDIRQLNELFFATRPEQILCSCEGAHCMCVTFRPWKDPFWSFQGSERPWRTITPSLSTRLTSQESGSVLWPTASPEASEVHLEVAMNGRYGAKFYKHYV